MRRRRPFAPPPPLTREAPLLLPASVALVEAQRLRSLLRGRLPRAGGGRPRLAAPPESFWLPAAAVLPPVPAGARRGGGVGNAGHVRRPLRARRPRAARLPVTHHRATAAGPAARHCPALGGRRGVGRRAAILAPLTPEGLGPLPARLAAPPRGSPVCESCSGRRRVCVRRQTQRALCRLSQNACDSHGFTLPFPSPLAVGQQLKAVANKVIKP